MRDILWALLYQTNVKNFSRQTLNFLYPAGFVVYKRMKIIIERTEDRAIAATQDRAQVGKQMRPSGERLDRSWPGILLLIAMVAAVLFLDAALTLRDLWFHDALLTQMGAWPVLPALLVFPGRALLVVE